MPESKKRLALITGANGFVGRALCAGMLLQGWQIAGGVRCQRQLPAGVRTVVVGSINGETDWLDALDGVNEVIHLAARVPVMNDTAVDPLAEFRKVNVDGTLNLARQAAKAGVKRFIFFSSIGVLGSETLLSPFSELSEPNPHSDYAVSKLEAEEGLKKICAETGMEFVIIRPPLIYGASAPGNFARLLRLVNLSLPLPLGAINNQRSMVSLENLVDFVNLCIIHPKAANQIFLVADGTDVSTPKLIRLLGEGMGKSVRLAPVPVKLLELVASVIGKQNMVQQLCGSLQIDIGKARNVLNWTPPVPVDEGLRRAAQRFKCDRAGSQRRPNG